MHMCISSASLVLSDFFPRKVFTMTRVTDHKRFLHHGFRCVHTLKRQTFRDWVEVYLFADGPCPVLLLIDISRSRLHRASESAERFIKQRGLLVSLPSFAFVGLGRSLRIGFSKEKPVKVMLSANNALRTTDSH